MNSLYSVRLTGKTKLNNRYAALQDAPGDFHVTVQTPENAIYEYFTQVMSKEDLEERTHKLELELYPPLLEEPIDEVA